MRDVDVALDTRGGPDMGGVQTVKPGGMVVSLKGTGERATQEAAAARGVQLRAIMVQPNRAVLIQVGERLQDRATRVEIASELPLTDIARAHAMVETGHVRGRVVLRL